MVASIYMSIQVLSSTTCAQVYISIYMVSSVSIDIDIDTYVCGRGGESCCDS